MPKSKKLRLIVYGDERTAAVKNIEVMLREFELPFSVVPTGGGLPRVSGPCAENYDMAYPGRGDFREYLHFIKQNYFAK